MLYEVITGKEVDLADSFGERARKAWNVFWNPEKYLAGIGAGYGDMQDRYRMYLGTEKSIVSAVYNRIGIDVSSIPLHHVRLDQIV